MTESVEADPMNIDTTAIRHKDRHLAVRRLGRDVQGAADAAVRAFDEAEPLRVIALEAGRYAREIKDESKRQIAALNEAIDRAIARARTAADADNIDALIGERDSVAAWANDAERKALELQGRLVERVMRRARSAAVRVLGRRVMRCLPAPTRRIPRGRAHRSRRAAVSRVSSTADPDPDPESRRRRLSSEVAP